MNFWQKFGEGYTEWFPAISDCTSFWEGSSNCTSWDPGSHVSYNTGTSVYEVDESFIHDIIADPLLLLECDGGRFEPLAAAPGFQLVDANTGELSSVLGLQNGDVPLELNGFSLDDVDDVLTAFNRVYNLEETEFTLDILRGSTPITLEYELVP